MVSIESSQQSGSLMHLRTQIPTSIGRSFSPMSESRIPDYSKWAPKPDCEKCEGTGHYESPTSFTPMWCPDCLRGTKVIIPPRSQRGLGERDDEGNIIPDHPYNIQRGRF